MKHPLLEHVESKLIKTELPQFAVGDTVEVRTRIREGDKERVQAFIGVCIVRKGEGTSAAFTVRRLVGGEGVERTFLLHSPLIEDVTVSRSGKVRRARLYYLRDRVGKATRLKERRRRVVETEQ